MAKLVLHGKDGPQREISLGKQRVTIGRREDNDVCLDDQATSNQHAAVITIGRNSYLQDLQSTNGTMVNGNPVTKHTLKHGDVILIGRSHMSFVGDNAESRAKLAEELADADVAAGKPAELAPDLAEAAAPKEPATAENFNFSKAEIAMQKPAPSSESKLFAKTASKTAAFPGGVPGSDEPPSEYKPWASQEVPTDNPTADMVDSMLNAIRSHRSQEQGLQEQKKQKLDQEWNKLLTVCAALKSRLAGTPRLQFFEIARDKSDVMIRIQRSNDANATGQHVILLAREHPHTPSLIDTIWLIETGRHDKRFQTCEEAMREVMITLAPLLA